MSIDNTVKNKLLNKLLTNFTELWWRCQR